MASALQRWTFRLKQHLGNRLGWTAAYGRGSTLAENAKACLGPARAHGSLTAGIQWLSARGAEFNRPFPQELSEEIRTFARDLASCHQRADVEFVALTKSLRDLHGTAAELGTVVNEQLEKVRVALQATRIGGPDGIAASTLRDLQCSLVQTSTELQALTEAGDDLQRLRTQVRGIETAGNFIRTTVFNFAIETGRVEAFQQTFGSFVGELRSLAEAIARVADGMENQARSTQVAQRQELDRLSASHSQLCQTAKGLETTAGAAAAEAQALIDQVLDGLKSAETRMSRIAENVSRCVYYLQFGDILRQKTEHVADALLEAANCLDDRDENARSRASRANAVIAIQIKQLQLAHSEVDSARRALEESFTALGRETEELREALCLGGRNAADPLQTFQADLLQLERLQKQGSDVRERARQAGRTAADAYSGLASYVKDVKKLNADMHLQALNAIIKAAALNGSGSTLSVLSMHVHSLYRTCGGTIGEIVEILGSIQRRTQDQLATSGASAITVAEDQLRAGMDQIATAYGAYRQTAASASVLVERQQKDLLQTDELLDFLARHAAAVEQQAETLQRFIERFAPGLIQSENASAADLAQLRERYTMESERLVHSDVAREGKPAATLIAAKPSTPANDSPTVALATASVAADDNIEFF